MSADQLKVRAAQGGSSADLNSPVSLIHLNPTGQHGNKSTSA